MFVFAVGLNGCLCASPQRSQHPPQQAVDVTGGREVPDMPAIDGEAGSGFAPVGRVHRGRASGKLILIEE